MRRRGWSAHDVASRLQLGCALSDVSKRAAESASSGSDMGPFGPASPPKSKESDVSKGVRVCQVTAGPCDEQLEQPATSCHGGAERAKDALSGKKRTSLLTGAELYAYALNSSVRPP